MSDTLDHEHIWKWKGWLFGREGSGELHYCTLCHLMKYRLSDDYQPWEKRKESPRVAASPITRVPGGQPIPLSAAG